MPRVVAAAVVAAVAGGAIVGKPIRLGRTIRRYKPENPGGNTARVLFCSVPQ